MRWLVAVLIIALPFTAKPQKGLPAFGKITKEDLELTDCDFDKGAQACKLIDWASVYYDRGGASIFKLITERRVRIKILKEKGLSYANVKIPFITNNNNERIERIEAFCYNLNTAGNIISSSVDKKSIFIKRLGKTYSEVTIAFPEARSGSVIEYRYRLESDYYRNIDDWFFQDEIPTRISQYELKLPSLFYFKEDKFVYMTEEKKEDVRDELMTMGNGETLRTKVHSQTMILRNVPGIRDEPFQPTKKDYMQHISFQLAQINYGNGNTEDVRTDWEDVMKGLMENEDLGLELQKPIAGADAVKGLTTGCTDSLCKMTTVYNYVKSNMNWNQSRMIYSTQGIRTAWDKKTGNIADINIILIRLLQEVGLNAKPILFSTKDNGSSNRFYPTEKQFNFLLAYLQIGNKPYFLNAADKSNPFNLVPFDIANTSGFLMDGENGRWIEADNHDRKYKQFAAVRGDIDDHGSMKGDATVFSHDYAKMERVGVWLENRNLYRDRYFVKPYSGSNIKVDELEVNNVGNDSLPLEQKIKFTASLNSSGNYQYFNINLFSDLYNNPFVADERQTDIDFNFGQEYVLYGNYTIPENYVFEEVPRNVSMIMPDTSILFNRILSTENNALSIRITVEFKKKFYLAQDYDYFRAFYKKMFGKLNEQIVIRKK